MSSSHSSNRSRMAINNSMSKQMYSFYNSPRFNMREKGSNCFYYDLPSLRSPRAASLGRGSKIEFEKMSTHSNGKLYNSHNANATMYKSPSYSFGLGREQCRNNTHLGVNINPEPTTYNIKSLFGNQALKYSIRKKWQSKALKVSPGPGTYNSIDLNPNGYYPVSNIVNSLHLPFSLSKEVRFKCRSLDISPSPSTYDIKSLFNETGALVLSQHYSNISKTIGKKAKHPIIQRNSPGPGHYAHFSSFSGFHS